jgi:hypothetical protein
MTDHTMYGHNTGFCPPTILKPLFSCSTPYYHYTMVHQMAAVPHRKQTSSLLALLGCLLVYSLLISSHSTHQVISITTIIVDSPSTSQSHQYNDRPASPRQAQTVITTTNISTVNTGSQSRSRDQEPTHEDQRLRTVRAASSSSDAIVEKGTAGDAANPTKRETQILAEEAPLSSSVHSATNKTSIHEEQDDGIDPVAWSNLKIAVFMTSHLSVKHLKFLHQCWPYASGYLPLLQNSHLILYTSADPPQEALEQMKFKSITVRRYEDKEPSTNSTGESKSESIKQMGAKRAMVDPFEKDNRWFDGYDWVIRLNPDVLIRRDTWIRQTMLNTSIDGIFVDYSSKQRGRLHTDFYAFRPSAVNEKALRDNLYSLPTAETHLFSGFGESVRRKRVAWLPGATTRRGWARLIGKESPVVHFHPLFNKCPHYFNATYQNIY